ncbi:MAG: Pyrophosphate--fructose 6-phosphate 1-phosphotransferase [Candidatus Heimdallarchaeota archaeon LC_2]|nr:MAG: Pyrophosphate--fructose 6-phosphate 1-phosphotransferase [Candidatus Heimdallarchaeota archaeon LC_2]
MRFGILTSGGDTPGMNAVIRAALIKCKNKGHELIGIKYGWKGLLENIIIEIPENLIDEVNLGGTILGSARTNPIKQENYFDKINKTMSLNNLDVIIAIGGEDTLGAAKQLFDEGFPLIGVPKTIDNDLDATDYTFGFNTAITIVTEAFDRLKTTAKSHERVMVVEIMGRHAGWMTLHGGIAGGAHIILIPEYELSIKTICNVLQKRFDAGHNWALVAVSEGYGFHKTGEVVIDQEKDEYGHFLLEKQEVGVSIAKIIEEKLGKTTRATVLGHTQRGGPPTSFDRVLCTQLGLKAIELAETKNFGKMPALEGTKIITVSLDKAVSRLKTVDLDSWKVALDIMGI